MSYSSYDHDDLEPASTMRIERRIYFESGKADLSEAVKLPLAELLSLRAESAAAEQEVFDRLKEQAAAWEEQAGRTLFLDKALEYARTLPVTHTANQWEAPDEYRHIRSNMVYQMDPSNQFSKSPKNKNSQRIMWYIPHNTLAIRFTYCLYRSIPFFSSINFPSKISCNTCLHGIRCNLLTSDASITRKVVW